jgi:hypothetical protein
MSNLLLSHLRWTCSLLKRVRLLLLLHRVMRLLLPTHRPK